MIHVIENEWIRLSANPEQGTSLSLINKKTGQEHMWVNDYLHLPNIMFPQCGSFVNDQYQYEGKTYTLTEHGFVRHSNLEFVGGDENKIVFRLDANDETRKMYPFEFRFEVTYSLVEKHVEILYTVLNMDTKDMYYALGCHQGYATPIDPTSDPKDAYLEFEAPETADTYVLHGMMVDDEHKPFLNNEKEKSLAHMFDEGGIVLDVSDLKSRSITIRHKKSPYGTRVSFPDAKILILSALSGPCGFVCIEPWHGMFQRIGHDGNIKTREGMVTLAPGQIGQMLQKIELI